MKGMGCVLRMQWKRGFLVALGVVRLGGGRGARKNLEKRRRPPRGSRRESTRDLRKDRNKRTDDTSLGILPPGCLSRVALPPKPSPDLGGGSKE